MLFLSLLFLLLSTHNDPFARRCRNGIYIASLKHSTEDVKCERHVYVVNIQMMCILALYICQRQQTHFTVETNWEVNKYIWNKKTIETNQSTNTPPSDSLPRIQTLVFRLCTYVQIRQWHWEREWVAPQKFTVWHLHDELSILSLLLLLLLVAIVFVLYIVSSVDRLFCHFTSVPSPFRSLDF